uniref:feruloyl esterase n=1 Tax=Phytophthora ramorum TaxID=164328 RepID=H3G6Y7_PHYRM
RLGVAKPVTDCKSLLDVDLSHVTEEGGTTVTSATETTHEGHLYCFVEGTLPASTKWEVMLPVRTWTQRYMQIGCGGLCGMIHMQVNAASGSQYVAGGEFALAATDMGGAMDGKVFANNPGRRESFAYSAQHLTSLVSKTLIQAYYGQKPRYSYFNGCSDGGREGVMEALRYPNDFDGILAGAPAMLFQFQNSLHHGWLAMSPPGRGPPGHGSSDHGPAAIVTASKLPLLHSAVVRACDALDGLVDGLLSEPRLCNFDPRELLCATEMAAAVVDRQCLTEAEVNTIRKFYNGPVDPATGSHLTVGQAQFGSELAWEGVFVPRGRNQPVMSAHIALAALRYLIFEPNPPETYSLNDLKFTEATVELLRPRHPLLDATNPDLAAFKAAGGKLILWHGWSDEHISPRTTIAYHEALQKQMGGPDQVAAFERLYLLPGVQHCGRGEGMAAIDLVTPLLEWVEQGSAPHAIMTSTELDVPPWMAAAPAVTRSRPVFPYPSLAKYTGQGDANDAANFVQGAPLYTDKTADWAGQSFFEPY